jgi:hypothetical protein
MYLIIVRHPTGNSKLNFAIYPVLAGKSQRPVSAASALADAQRLSFLRGCHLFQMTKAVTYFVFVLFRVFRGYFLNSLLPRTKNWNHETIEKGNSKKPP